MQHILYINIFVQLFFGCEGRFHKLVEFQVVLAGRTEKVYTSTWRKDRQSASAGGYRLPQ